MGRRQTDKDWEEYGSANPYYGVLSDPKFLGKKLSRDIKQEFFDSGRVHADKLFQTISTFLGRQFRSEKTLDFGCGVGRITQAFAGYSELVVGVDVSPSMLTTAKSHLSSQLKTKISYKDSDNELANNKQYNLVHSFIVLQHIPKEAGYKITHRLIEKTTSGGVVALHYTFATHIPKMERFIQLLRYRIPPVHYSLNAIRGKALKEPMMHIYSYNINKLLLIFLKHDITSLNIEITRHGDYSGVFIIGQKP